MKDPIFKKRRYPIGAEIIPNKGVHFRVWAPDHKNVDLILENVDHESVTQKMKSDGDGYFSFLSKDAKEGTLYRFSLPTSSQWYPDPASRYQPHGPKGPSCVIDPNYSWKDDTWPGVDAEGHIIYELHIGTFTKAGTFNAAMHELPRLASLGITLIEVLPINDFPGHFGWGYDGVNLFAPTRLYGHPKDVKAFVDKAHQLGIGVVLDVVYNHLGPEDNYMIQFAEEYLSDKFHTDWGKAINFDSLESRKYFLTNAQYWIEEYHFDGLRFDATPWLFCSTPVHILTDFTKVVKKAGGKRKTISIAENEQQNTNLIKPYELGGHGFDLIWNDDFHHTACVRLTGKREAYYTDYLGSPQEFISSIKYGFLYQGQYYDWQKNTRGTPYLDAPRHSYVLFLENHDQIANTGWGRRMHKNSDPGNYKAMCCLMLLSANTPMLFQGQEFNSEQPFYYFADHAPDLSLIINKGRKDELSQFPRLANKEARKALPDPDNPLTFIESKLRQEDLEANTKIYAFFQDLIHLRKKDPVFSKMQNLRIDGAVLGSDAFLIRYFGGEDGDRLLIINFGPDHYFNPAPEPLLVPGPDHDYDILFSSESLIYGGEGTPPINVPYWKLLGHSAIVLKTKTKKRADT